MSTINDIEYVYTLVLFTIYNLIVFDVESSAISIKLMALLIMGLIASFGMVLEGKLFTDIRKDRYRMAVILFALLWLVKELVFGTLDVERPMFILAMALMYCVISAGVSIDSRLVHILSISNALIYVFIIFAMFVMDSYEVMGTGKTSFLTMAVILDILGYCTYDDMRIWYGANAGVGAFLLFAQKNIPAVIVVSFGILLIPAVFAPTKRLVRKCSQMLFMYCFLFSNMSLITGYITPFKGLAQYSLEISVYMELAYAVIGVIFFTLWDKYAGDDVDEGTVLYRFRNFYIGILILMTVVAGGLAIMSIGGNGIMESESMSNIIGIVRDNIAKEENIFQMAGESYGILGVIVAVVVISFAAYLICVRTDETDTHKMVRILTIIYLLQALLVTQSLFTAPVYLALSVAYYKAADGWKYKMNYIQGENVYEIDNTDTLLQRGGDVGDSLERPAEEA